MGTRLSCLRLLLASLVPAVAFVATSPAGPNADGVLLLHANRSLVYTVDTQDYCGQSDLSACSLAVATVPWEPDTTRVFYVLAAFPATSQPRLKALSFGVDWDPDKLVVLGHGSCGDFEIADNSWPDPGTGTGLSWNQVQTGLLVDVYWFAAYTYSANDPDTTSFAVTPHPIQGAVMVDDATPPNEDVVAAFGRLGFGTTGSAPCPAGGDSGGDSPGGGDGPVGGGDEPGNPGGDSPEISTVNCAPRSVLIRFAPNEVSFPQETPSLHEFFIRSLDDAEFSRSNLRSVLEDVGVETFETVAPEWRHLTEDEELDIHGRRIDLVDFTNVYRLALDGSSTVAQVIDSLWDAPGVQYVECDQLVSLFFSTPNDSLYPEQWYLDNTGQVDTCEASFDINASDAWAIQDSSGSKIGVSDFPINDSVPGLSEYVDTDLSRSFVPGESYWTQGLGVHGTKVASIAGAGTDDTLNIASLANLPKNHAGGLIVALRTLSGDPTSLPDSLQQRAHRALAYVSSSVGGAVRVVNHSWGGPLCKGSLNYPQTLRDAFRNAFLSDIALVTAAGNEGACNPTCAETGDTCFAYPAAFPDYSLAVAAVDCNGRTDPSYKRGSYLDLAAPGFHVHTLDPDTVYLRGGGTSLAAPFVSATLALMYGVNPGLTAEDCYNILRLSAREIPDASPVTVGSGLLDAGRALSWLVPPRTLVQGTASECETLLVGEHVLYFKNVDIDLFGCSPGTWCQVWAKIYKLTTQVATADTVSIDGIWARGRLSSGCRLIDESLNYHYDAHFFASAASVRTAGPWIAEFTSYTYHLFDQQGGNPLRWFPFDPTDSLATFRLDYSFVANTDPASVSSDALRADGQPRVVAWMKQEEVVFQFRVDGVGPSTVAIFDVGGREVRVLHSEASAGPGLRAVRWDQRNSAGRRVPSGVYFARVWATGEKGRGSGWPARVVIVR